jgi:ribosomal protein S18 acetylase RimI-like enzyme
LSDGIGNAFLVDLVVHRDYQRDHIGTAIVKQAVRDLTDDGVQCIEVTFNPENEAFYKSIGFHIFKAGIIDNKTMKVNL